MYSTLDFWTQTSQEGNECTSTKEKLRAYYPNIYLLWAWPSSHDKPTTTLLRGHNEIEINCPSSRVGNDVPFFSLLAKTSTKDTRSSLFKFSRLLYHVSQSLRGLATAHYIRGASKEEFFWQYGDNFVTFFPASPSAANSRERSERGRSSTLFKNPLFFSWSCYIETAQNFVM